MISDLIVIEEEHLPDPDGNVDRRLETMTKPEPRTCSTCNRPLSKSTRGDKCREHMQHRPVRSNYIAPRSPDVRNDPAAKRYEGPE